MSKFSRLFGALVIGGGIVAGAFFGGAAYGYQNRSDIDLVSELANKELDKPSEVDFNSFWKVWRLINERYVPVGATTTSLTVGADEKVWGAIEGLVDSLGDPYTVFMPPQENKMFEEEVSGKFGGVGMEVGVRDQSLTIVTPLPNTPAAEAGLKTGDRIMAIDGTNTAKMSVNEAVALIRGEIGSKVALTIMRQAEGDDRETFDVTLTRARIEVPTLDHRLLADNIYLIKLYNFSGTSDRQFRTALQSFVKAKTDKLILDLRGNPGGYLESAVSISSWFLPKGEVIVREERRDGEEEKLYKSSGGNLFNDKLKMAILVDGGSASASEIVAGALREHGIATLIGEQTFGKGSVQELIPITNETSLKVTVARWLTPQGLSISDGGLKPDIEVKTATSSDPSVDVQLEAAAKFLKTKK